MLRRVLSLVVAAALLIAVEDSCMKNADQQVVKKMTVNSKNELYVYLDTLEQRYEQACERMGLANWNNYSQEATFDLDGAKAEFAGIFGDTTARSIIETWRGRASSLSDKPLARRLELWHRCFIGGAVYADPGIAAIENRLQQTITGFKLKMGDSLLTRAQVSNRLR